MDSIPIHHAPTHTALLPNSNHHRYSPMTQPCHKDTTQTNNAVTENIDGGKWKRRREEEERQCERDRTTQEGRKQCEGEDPIRTREQHTPTLPPFNGTTTQTEGEHYTQDGEASNTAALPSPCHPPPQHTPHRPQWPHPPPRRGGSGQRIPHHTNTTDTHPPPTHHAPGK